MRAAPKKIEKLINLWSTLLYNVYSTQLKKDDNTESFWPYMYDYWVWARLWNNTGYQMKSSTIEWWYWYLLCKRWIFLFDACLPCNNAIGQIEAHQMYKRYSRIKNKWNWIILLIATWHRYAIIYMSENNFLNVFFLERIVAFMIYYNCKMSHDKCSA